MKRVVMLVAMSAVLVAAPLVAQQPASAKTAPGKEKAAAPANTDKKPTAQAVNVRAELTLTDQTGTEKPIVKTVTLLAADSSWSRTRAVSQPEGEPPAMLSADVQPRILSDNRIQLDIAIDYRPPRAEDAKARIPPPQLTESLTVVLQDGKPLMVVQSADATSDRRVTLEVKATILR